MSQLREDAKTIERIDKFGRGLTARERDFVESCLERLATGEALSDAQRKWAMDIDDRKVGA